MPACRRVLVVGDELIEDRLQVIRECVACLLVLLCSVFRHLQLPYHALAIMASTGGIHLFGAFLIPRRSRRFCLCCGAENCLISD